MLNLQSLLLHNPPSGVPALSPFTYSATAHGSVTTAVVPIIYATITANASATFLGVQALAFSLPSSLSQGLYSIGSFDNGTPTQGWMPALGPISASGTSINFPGFSGPISLVAGESISYALFAGAPPP